MTHPRLTAILALLLMLVANTSWAGCRCDMIAMAPGSAEMACSGHAARTAPASECCAQLTMHCMHCLSPALLSAPVQAGPRISLEPVLIRVPVMPSALAVMPPAAEPDAASDPPLRPQTPISLHTRLLV